MTFVGPNWQIVNWREDYDPSKGDSFSTVHEGTEAAMRGIKATLRHERPDLTTSVESTDQPLWQCVVRSSEDTSGGVVDAVTTWEILSNDINKSIYESNKALAAGNDNIKEVREGLKNDDTFFVIAAKFTGTDDQKRFAYDLLVLLQKGVTDFLVSQFVLRRTLIVASSYQIANAFLGIDRVWSGTQISDIEPIPPTILFTLGAIPNPDVPPTIGGVQYYRVGWLKKSPTIMQIPNGKYQIHQEWWLGTPAYFLYDTYVPS